MSGFETWPDTASRALGGAVMWCNDESFASVHALVDPRPPAHDPLAFAASGKVYDGWETRRRREPGDDVAIVRLAAPTVVHGVIVDTSFFTGNYPPAASVQTTVVLGHPDVAALQSAQWTTVVDRAPITGGGPNPLTVTGEPRLATHVRLVIHPDGGVARLRVHGEVVADPTWLGGRVDLAALLHGGRVLDCSNLFYSSPANALAPGRAAVMSDGWETARRRDDGNDWLVVALAAPGRVEEVVVDTTRFVFNAPGRVQLADADTGAELLPLTPVVPDGEHRFRLHHDGDVAAVRLDIFPDGGISRLRVRGTFSAAAREQLADRWLSLLPADQAAGVDRSAFFA